MLHMNRVLGQVLRLCKVLLSTGEFCVAVIVSYIMVSVWAVFAVHDTASAALLGNLPNEAAMVHLQDFVKTSLTRLLKILRLYVSARHEPCVL